MMLAKMGSKGASLVQLMGIPPEIPVLKTSLSPHTRHVLQLVIADKIKEKSQRINLR